MERLARLLQVELHSLCLGNARSNAVRLLQQLILVHRPQPYGAVVSGACQQVVKLGGDIDLEELPALKSAPLEPGRVITAGQIFAADAESGQSSVGRYELLPLGRDRMAVCWSEHDDPARLILGYRERNSRMPLAVVLGGDPAGLLAAMAPLPPDSDASAVAGLLRGKPRELVKCRTVDLEAPTDAEIVIEGYVDPADPPVDAGPVCVSGGSYKPAHEAPIVHVTALTHRANPIYPAMVPGMPPDEFCVVNRFLTQAFLPLVQMAIPELVDYDLPTFAATRRWATVSIRKTHAGQARRVAHAAWGLRQLMFAKLLVIVDEEVDVHDHQQVLSAIDRNANPGGDVFFAEGPPDPLDPAATAGQLGQKMAIDATTKLPTERGGQPYEPAAMDPEIRQLVTDRWVEYGLGPEDGCR